MIRLRLIALTGVHFDDDVYEVMLPTEAGEIGVYQDHASLLGVVAPGVVAIRKDRKVRDEEREFVAIYGGTVEVLNNVITVLVDEVDDSSEVNEAEAKKAHQRALEMKDKAKDALSLQEAQKLIDRSSVRLKLAGLKKHSHRR